MKKDKKHLLIGKNILVISTFLFAVVLVMTFLTLLSYKEISLELNDVGTNKLNELNELNEPSESNESTKKSNEPTKRSNESTKKSNEPTKKSKNANDESKKPEEKNLMKEDPKDLKEFLDVLNGVLLQENQLTENLEKSSKQSIPSINDFKLTNLTSNNSSTYSKRLDLNQDWQMNSLNISNAFAQKLNRVISEEEEDYDMLGNTNYPKIYENPEPKNYQLPNTPKEGTYSDEDYEDKSNKENSDDTVIVYDKNKSDDQDNGEVKYYLIRKEHNRINLATQNEVKGLNELISNALSKDYSSAKYNPMHINIQAPNLYAPPAIPQPVNIIPPQYPPYFAGGLRDHYPSNEFKTQRQDQTAGLNSWNNWAKKQIPYTQLTLKQRVKVNLCEKMLKKVKVKPSKVVLSTYTSKDGYDGAE